MLLKRDRPSCARTCSRSWTGGQGPAKPAAGQLNDALHYLNPALGQTAALGSEVVLDQHALERLVAATGQVSRAVASREAAWAKPWTDANVMTALAARRRELAGVLDQAPSVAHQAQASLAAWTHAAALDPVFREARPAIAPLAGCCARRRRSRATRSRRSPPIRKLLRRRPPRCARPQLDRDAPAWPRPPRPARPAARGVGLRAYAPDLVGGFFNGFGGATGGYYDATATTPYLAAGAQSSFPVAADQPNGPTSAGYRTGLTARCPGGAEEPAPDGSNPWSAGPQGPVQPERRSPRMRRALLVICLGAVPLAVAALVLRGGPRTPTATASTRLRPRRGLIPGQLVEVAGARVGKIDNVTLTGDYKARIQMTVDKRFAPFRADATCTSARRASSPRTSCSAIRPRERRPLAGRGDGAPTVP